MVDTAIAETAFKLEYSKPWNNGNRDPRWGVVEMQKMSPPTTVGDAAAVLSNKGVPQFWEM